MFLRLKVLIKLNNIAMPGLLQNDDFLFDFGRLSLFIKVGLVDRLDRYHPLRKLVQR
jgi:hypothetical protein